MSYLTALSLFVCLLNAYIFKGPAFAGRTPSCPHEAFAQYNQFYGKNHTTEAERQLRFWNFLENTKRIEQWNVERPLGPDAWFQHTQFSDMTQSEFKETMNGLKLSQPVALTPQPRNLSAPTTAINWVAKGKTTAVKNQGQCGSCWTFSAAETAESANLMANNQAGAQHGSEQEILDCCHAGGSAGCRGGDPRGAIEWIGQTGGLELNSCYPYRAADGPCESSLCKKAYTVRRVYAIAQNENTIYEALGKYGPLSIGVDAELWQNYGGGIISGPGCGTQMDHAVQLVGYSPGSGGYWIVRNSWGASWGNGGFVYLAFGQDVCGIRTYVTAATA